MPKQPKKRISEFFAMFCETFLTVILIDDTKTKNHQTAPRIASVSRRLFYS